MRRVFPRFLLLLSLCAGHAALAQDTALYEGEAPVADQSEEERRAALPRALAQVLVKVTGDAGAATDFAGALGGAARMMQQYRYRQDVAPVAGAPQIRLFLLARFNRAAVDALVGGAGRTVWPTPRPKPVLWLAIDDGRGARLVGAAQAGAVAPLLRRGSERGLAFELPKADLQDQTLGGAQAVWREDAAAISSAAARYGQAPVLIGRMQRGGSGWTANWMLLDGGAVLQRWEATDANAAVVLAAGADGAASTLSKHYSSRILSGPAGDYDIAIVGLADADDYGRTMQYLQGLPIVTAIAVHEAVDDRLLLKISLRTGVEGLARLVAGGGVLRAEGTSGDAVTLFRLE